MKISDMIKSLELMKENCGDREVAVLNHSSNLINRAFAICQYDLGCRDRDDKIIVPYLQDKSFVVITGGFFRENQRTD